MPKKEFANEGKPFNTIMQALHYLHTWQDGRSSGGGELRLPYPSSGLAYIFNMEYREGSSGGDSSWRLKLLVSNEVIAELKDKLLVVGKPYMGGRYDNVLITTEQGQNFYWGTYFAMNREDKEKFNAEMHEMEMNQFVR